MNRKLEDGGSDSAVYSIWVRILQPIVTLSFYRGRSVNSEQLFEQCLQLIQTQRIGTIRLGVRRIVVNLQKEAIDTSRHCGPR